MKLFFTIIILYFSGMFLFAKDSKDSLLNNKLTYQQEIAHLLGNQDTLKLMIIQNKKELPESNLQKNMPWICAVLLGFFTIIANNQISKHTRQSNKEAIERQIESATAIAMKQIENASRTSQLDFNKTVLSANRQAWIKELRELISAIFSKSLTFTFAPGNKLKELEELLSLLNEADLMLNDIKDKELISALGDLKVCLVGVILKTSQLSEIVPATDKLRELAKTTLKTEWERVKRGE